MYSNWHPNTFHPRIIDSETSFREKGGGYEEEGNWGFVSCLSFKIQAQGTFILFSSKCQGKFISGSNLSSTTHHPRNPGQGTIFIQLSFFLLHVRDHISRVVVGLPWAQTERQAVTSTVPGSEEVLSNCGLPSACLPQSSRPEIVPDFSFNNYLGSFKDKTKKMGQT